MTRTISPAVLLAALLTGALALSATATTAGASTRQAAAPLPRVPAALGVPAQFLLIRPSSITYTGDGTGILTGSKVRAGKSALHWSSWTPTTAFGTGDNQINNCTPSCAGGKYTAYPVRLEAWRSGVLHGQRVFTRLTIWYTGVRPSGEPAHYTFTDLYDENGWGFGPPDENGYCLDTEGQPKAAGCANVNALP